MRIDELRRREHERGGRVRQHAAVVRGLAAVHGAVLATAALYISFPARIAEQMDVYQFALSRPGLRPFLRVAPAAVLGGALLAWILVRVTASSRPPRLQWLLVRWLLVGLLFGVANPFLTWALLPFVIDVVDLFGGALPFAAFWPRLGENLVDVLRFSSVNGILSLYVGLASGAVMAIGGLLIEVLAVAEGHGRRSAAPVIALGALGAVIVAAVFFGPFSWFEALVHGIGTRAR